MDPYFTAEGYIVYKEDGVELEEAFAKTTSLPFGLQAKMGFFLTEFGIMNPTHPHAWDWIDQPVIVTRLLGGEGTQGIGYPVELADSFTLVFGTLLRHAERKQRYRGELPG